MVLAWSTYVYFRIHEWPVTNIMISKSFKFRGNFEFDPQNWKHLGSAMFPRFCHLFKILNSRSYGTSSSNVTKVGFNIGGQFVNLRHATPWWGQKMLGSFAFLKFFFYNSVNVKIISKWIIIMTIINGKDRSFNARTSKIVLSKIINWRRWFLHYLKVFLPLLNDRLNTQKFFVSSIFYDLPQVDNYSRYNSVNNKKGNKNFRTFSSISQTFSSWIVCTLTQNKNCLDTF